MAGQGFQPYGWGGGGFQPANWGNSSPGFTYTHQSAATKASSAQKSGGSMEGSDWIMYAIMAAGAGASALATYFTGSGANDPYGGNKADKFVTWLGPKLMAGLPDDAIAKMFKPTTVNFDPASYEGRKSVGLVMPHSGGVVPGGAGLVKGAAAAGAPAGLPAGLPAGPPAGGGTAGGGGPQAQTVAFTGGGAQGGGFQGGGFQGGGFQGGGFQGGGFQGGGAQGGQHPDLPKVLQLIDSIKKRGFLPRGQGRGGQAPGGRQMV
jgi:hypothetical protein